MMISPVVVTGIVVDRIGEEVRRLRDVAGRALEMVGRIRTLGGLVRQRVGSMETRDLMSFDKTPMLFGRIRMAVARGRGTILTTI